MSEYSYSVSLGFATNDNVTLVNDDIDAQVLDNTRLNTENRGGSLAFTFSNPLSSESAHIIEDILRLRDNRVFRGDKVIVIYPLASVKSSVYKVVASIPFQSNWKITHIEVTSYMSPGLNHYTVQVYDLKNSEVIAEKQLNNTERDLNDLGLIENLPILDSVFEINVKTNGSKLLTANIESIVITYYNNR